MNKNTLDLVLVNPGGSQRIYQTLAASMTAIEPPVWAGLIAEFVRRKGYSVHIIDAQAEELTPEETAGIIDMLSPALVTVVVYGHQPSASTQNMTEAGSICRAIKQNNPNQKVLLLGGHVAALPERTLREETADYVASGEGLYTVIDTIASLKANSAGDLSNVPGLWYRRNGHFVSTPPSPLLQNLDENMPGIAWDLLPMPKYRAHNWHCFGDLNREPYAALYTTLGCPYHCSFCCIQAPFKEGEQAAGMRENVNSYRYWSVDSVMQQIDFLVHKYNVRNFKIADEMFVLNRNHVAAICDQLIQRNYNLNIWAYARIDSVRDDMIEKLNLAGFRWLAFGIEAANDRVKDNVQKKMTQDAVYNTIGKVRKAGINVIGNYIFGLPEDDMNTMNETLQLAIDLNCEFANFYCTMAYPGSLLYRVAVKENLPLPEKWTGYSQHSDDSLPLPSKYLNAAEIIRFRDDAFQKYFNHPAYLEMVRRKFGDTTVAHIRQMVSFPLERQNK